MKPITKKDFVAFWEQYVKGNRRRNPEFFAGEFCDTFETKVSFERWTSVFSVLAQIRTHSNHFEFYELIRRRIENKTRITNLISEENMTTAFNQWSLIASVIGECDVYELGMLLANWENQRHDFAKWYFYTGEIYE